jgi:hypothetical protein
MMALIHRWAWLVSQHSLVVLVASTSASQRMGIEWEHQNESFEFSLLQVQLQLGFLLLVSDLPGRPA